MRIIIEGADGAGKSTLAKALGEYYNVRVIHLKGSDPMTWAFCKELLKMDNVIFDRSYISERVYSNFYELETRISNPEFNDLISKSSEFKILWCNPEVHSVMIDEDADIKERHDTLPRIYKSVIEHFNIDVISVDPFKTSVGDIIRLLEG